MRPIYCLLLLLSLPAAADTFVDVPTPAGADSMAPVFARAGEDIILTWLQRTGDGHALHVATYRDGRFGPAKTIAEGTDWFANWADMPGLFVTPGDDWLAHWLEKSADGTYTYDIRVKRSRDRGKTWSAPIVLHDDGTESEHGFVSYYPAGGNAAGVFWLDGRHTAGDSSTGAMTLRTAVVGEDGRIQRRRELDRRVCDCCQTDAAMTDAGPVVVYRNRSRDEIRDIQVRRRVRGRWQPPVTVGDDGWRIAACPVNGPAITAAGRQVTVAWFTMADDRPRVMLARSGDGGATFAEPVVVAEGESVQGRVDLIGHGADESVVSWLEDGALWLARFDATLGEIRRHSVTELDQGRISGFPRLAASSTDTVLVAWTTSSQGRPAVRVGRVGLDSN